MKVLRVRVSMLYSWRPKVIETIEDVREGRRSWSAKSPIVVSRLDSPRGGFFIVDGHHRAVEAVERRDRYLSAYLSEHVPRIERTGGAYRSWLNDKVNIQSYTRQRL